MADDQRPDTDDYDLLTFGEVAARIAEELAAERAELERLRRQPDPDPATVGQLEQRIHGLQVAAERYRNEQRTNDAFSRRFGTPTPSPADRPQWR